MPSHLPPEPATPPRPPNWADGDASWAATLALRLVRWRVPLFVLAVLLLLGAVERSRQLEYSRSIDAMFDRNDPALLPFRRMGRTFGSSEVVLAAYDDPDLFTPAGIARLRTLTDTLANLAGVVSATSLASTPLGDRIIETATSPAARHIVELMESYTISADHQTAAVVCVLAPASTTTEPRGPPAAGQGYTIERIRRVMADRPGGTVAGEAVMLRDGFVMLQRDGNLLGTTAGLLAAGVLFLLFRSLRWLAAPLAVIIVALWGTRGILAIVGIQLTMVSTMLSAMVTVVSIATVVHVIVEYRRQRSTGRPPEEALIRGLTVLCWPIVGAITTDCIGFGSLVASQVGPVHDFGVMTTIGAVVVLMAVATVLPFIVLVGRHDDLEGSRETDALDLGLDRLVGQIVARPWPILALSAGLVGLCLIGLNRLEVETDFTKNFRRSSQIAASYEMIESRLGGAGVLDVLLPMTNRSGVDGKLLARVAAMEDRLRTEVLVPATGAAALTKVLSIADVLAAVSPVPLERLTASPLGSWVLETAVTMMRQQLPHLSGALVGTDPTDGSGWLRIMLRSRERQPAATKRAIIDSVRRIVAEEMPPTGDGRAGEVTGFFVLLAQLIERMLADQWLTFGLAAGGILLLLTLAFRSPWIGLVALVPNALPIVIVLGLLGWIGVRVNMGTAMIAAVSMGLSVDSSIHYLAAFRRHLVQGATVATALAAAHRTAGRAMIFSTLALVVGFLSLCTSSFMPTVSFGGLSCLTLIGGLLGNLVVLPVLLAMTARPMAPRCQA